MPGHIPSLDEATLARLREYVLSLRRVTNGSLPLAQLVGLARDVHAEAGITIDLKASEQLGTPLVVVRVPNTPAPVSGLTPREVEVCGLIAEGRSNKQIASRLRITLGTVKDHVHNILRKTGLSNRAAVAARSAKASHSGGPGSRTSLPCEGE